MFCLWNHSLEELQKIFEFINNLDTTGKIKFTMFITNESELELLDLSLHTDGRNKISVDVFVKLSVLHMYYYLLVILRKTTIMSLWALV